MENSDSVSKILMTIGTPYDECIISALSNKEVNDLYMIAKRNKIPLLFLEALRTFRSLGWLQGDFDQYLRKYNDILKTATRLGSILNLIPCNYAIIKTLMPFRAVPNDVDVIILGNDQEYRSALSSMQDSSFMILAEAPLEVCFHDMTGGLHDDPSVKDPFDVDVYKEVGASHVIYMDKKKLLPFVKEVEIKSKKVRIMAPPAELAISIFHSIFPERIYTLMLHYQILHLIHKMTSSEFQMFVNVLEEASISRAALLVTSLTQCIQEKAFGRCPPKIKELRECLGQEKSHSNSISLPYIYPFTFIMKSFWSKKHDFTFTKSVLRQTLSLLNPNMATHVIREFTKRSKRDTY